MTRLPNVMDERREVEVGDWVAALTQARADGFTYFDWLTAVDQSDGDPGGVDVSRICMLIAGPRSPRRPPGDDAAAPRAMPLPSVTGVFRGAGWHEREVAEMFGVEVAGFDDGSGLGIRPLLLPDGFEGTRCARTSC
jgi:NADH-quinone oxidoreductase subunit C